MCSEDGCPTIKSWLEDSMANTAEGSHARSKAKAKSRGLCGKHGGEDKQMQSKRLHHHCTQKKGGYCVKHGGVHGFCAGDGCKMAAIAGGFACAKHGANGICADIYCTRNARTGKKVCFVHSTDRKGCSVAVCGRFAAARGLCRTHGANGFSSASSWAVQETRRLDRRDIHQPCTFLERHA